jgi:hypothetical protein
VRECTDISVYERLSWYISFGPVSEIVCKITLKECLNCLRQHLYAYTVKAIKQCYVESDLYLQTMVIFTLDGVSALLEKENGIVAVLETSQYRRTLKLF